MESASPPVSPKVVAAILMIQKIKVTSGTLLKAFSSETVISLPSLVDVALSAAVYFLSTAAHEVTSQHCPQFSQALHLCKTAPDRNLWIVSPGCAKLCPCTASRA